MAGAGENNGKNEFTVEIKTQKNMQICITCISMKQKIMKSPTEKFLKGKWKEVLPLVLREKVEATAVAIKHADRREEKNEEILHFYICLAGLLSQTEGVYFV